MLDDKTLALLGDLAAQERITEIGELLPCMSCKETATIKSIKRGVFRRRIYFYAQCPYCRNSSGISSEKSEVIAAWNRRARILTDEQMNVLKRIERTEDHKHDKE